MNKSTPENTTIVMKQDFTRGFPYSVDVYVGREGYWADRKDRLCRNFSMRWTATRYAKRLRAYLDEHGTIDGFVSDVKITKF